MLAIYVCGGFGRELIAPARAALVRRNRPASELVFIDDTAAIDTPIGGVEVHIFSYVAHDCYIGDHVTFAPRVNCNGNLHIEDFAYIGTGAMLRQGNPDKPLRIGKGATIGMGAVVTKDVAPGAVVVGKPARPL
jgi:acetyltransferase-like isoleucine patch superfamily enzyme